MMIFGILSSSGQGWETPKLSLPGLIRALLEPRHENAQMEFWKQKVWGKVPFSQSVRKMVKLAASPKVSSIKWHLSARCVKKVF